VVGMTPKAPKSRTYKTEPSGENRAWIGRRSPGWPRTRTGRTELRSSRANEGLHRAGGQVDSRYTVSRRGSARSGDGCRITGQSDIEQAHAKGSPRAVAEFRGAWCVEAGSIGASPRPGVPVIRNCGAGPLAGANWGLVTGSPAT